MRSPEIAPIDYRRHNKQIDSEYLDSNQIVLDSVKSIRDKFVCFQKEVLQKEKDKVALKEPLNQNLLYIDFEIGKFDDGKITPKELMLLNKSLELEEMTDVEIDAFYFETLDYIHQVDDYILKNKKEMGSSFVVKDDSKENLKDYLKNRINGAYLKRERDIPEERKDLSSAA